VRFGNENAFQKMCFSISDADDVKVKSNDLSRVLHWLMVRRNSAHLADASDPHRDTAV